MKAKPIIVFIILLSLSEQSFCQTFKFITPYQETSIKLASFRSIVTLITLLNTVASAPAEPPIFNINQQNTGDELSTASTNDSTIESVEFKRGGSGARPIIRPPSIGGSRPGGSGNAMTVKASLALILSTLLSVIVLNA